VHQEKKRTFMRFIYLIITLVFFGLGALYFLFRNEVDFATQCALCSHVLADERTVIKVVHPGKPLVEGHFILFTHRHVDSFDEFTQEEKSSLVRYLGTIDKMYLSEFGSIGHSQSGTLSTSGHLFFDVVPNKGFTRYILFQMYRMLRNFNLKGAQLFLDGKPVDLQNENFLKKEGLGVQAT
jgi:hypothetical protein